MGNEELQAAGTTGAKALCVSDVSLVFKDRPYGQFA